jgi:drug/metabolite transporter (DMT)-like permease
MQGVLDGRARWGCGMTETKINNDNITAQIGNAGSPAPIWAFVALIIGNVATAFGAVLVRYADTGPMATGFWRMAIALPILSLIAWKAGFQIRKVPPRIMGLCVLAGVCFGLDILAWHLSIFQTKLGNATLFGNCASLLLVIYGVIITRKLPNGLQSLAILLAVAGSAMLMLQSFELSPENLVGDILSLVAGLLYTFYLIFMIGVRQSTDSYGSMAVVSGFAGIVLLLAAVHMGEQIMPNDWTPLVILAISSQVVGQGSMIFALPYFSPLVIGLALLIQPTIAALTGWAAFGEQLTSMEIIGGLMVMTALVLVRAQSKA